VAEPPPSGIAAWREPIDPAVAGGGAGES
jgi:hypothetical protein